MEPTSPPSRVPVDFDYLSPEWMYNSTRNCTRYENDYCEPPEDYEDRMLAHITPDNYEWVLICANFIVFVVGLVGNALVCVAVFRNTTMRTVTNLFIVNLALADFMVILFCLPPTVAWDVTETWFLGDAMCKVVLYFQTVSISVSVLTLTVISVERWYAICFPLRFKATTARAKRLVLIIWVISLIIDIPELVVLQTSRREDVPVDTIYFMQCKPTWESQWDIALTILKMLLLYAIPLTFMSFAYYQIVKVLWSSANIPGNSTTSTVTSSGRRQTVVVNSNGSSHHNGQCQAQLLTPILRGTSSVQGAQADYQLKSRRKAAKMLVIVVIMFALCYLPVHIYSIASLVFTLPVEVKYLVMLSHWLCYFNSACNPVIYNLFSGKFRTEFLRTFGCRKWANNSRNRGHPMIRRHRHQQQARFGDPYYCGPRGTTGTGGNTKFKSLSTVIHAYSSTEC
ncbi:orexin receptor type 1 isoform X2 [Folsomia candida]|uniref:orexin receptor type 1 isoform X2 n=1 Tax=Folsomia candida TaxID=158441 RepID=UPI0016054854|nr:orexin receptor type 1 isoform X2 [Folsomia candida]